jgi:hypothetical protein
MRHSSSFDDEPAAEKWIAEVLDRRAADVDEWSKDPRNRLILVEDLGVRTGRILDRDGTTRLSTGVRVVLQPDPSAPGGWRILTAFPD